jgi:hypothetical protein
METFQPGVEPDLSGLHQPGKRLAAPSQQGRAFRDIIQIFLLK